MLVNPPGIEDIFPDRIDKWNFVTGTARAAFAAHNFREIVIPVLEYTDVFARGLGTDTDIVSKEMFTFEDRGGRSLTLRPEGTASVVRAYVSNGEYNRLSSAKFFYCGPMFRAERPQKGRLRQFNQFGAEFFGSSDPYYDFESIAMMDAITKGVGIADYTLLVNSIGCPDCRAGYIKELKSYYQGLSDKLCEDCVRRLQTNPLRLLDCKQEGCVALKADTPRITEFLDEGCRTHHAAVKEYLTQNSIAFKEDPLLVRGLDYYTRTTFEFTTTRLGGQNAFAAGGRYDNLVEQFGGKPTPAVGFAAGIERILLIIEDREVPASRLDAYIVHGGGASLVRAVNLASLLRAAGISCDLEPGQKGFKAQFKKADRERAAFALIIGDEEAASGTCMAKRMDTGAQEPVPLEKCVEFLRKALHL